MFANKRSFSFSPLSLSQGDSADGDSGRAPKKKKKQLRKLTTEFYLRLPPRLHYYRAGGSVKMYMSVGLIVLCSSHTQRQYKKDDVCELPKIIASVQCLAISRLTCKERKEKVCRE